jgi:hypothetical protein
MAFGPDAEGGLEAAREMTGSLADKGKDIVRDQTERLEAAVGSARNNTTEAVDALVRGYSTMARGAQEVQFAWLQLVDRSVKQAYGQFFWSAGRTGGKQNPAPFETAR